MRQSLISLIILLQLVAPLLHAHSGIEFNHDSLHLPGLEVIDNNLSDLQRLEPISKNDDFGVVFGVCTGIKQPAGIAEINSELPFIPSEKTLISSLQFADQYIVLQINSPPLNQSIRTNLSRAPPLLPFYIA